MSARKESNGARLSVDRALIRDLAKLLDETGLTEISWSEAGIEVRVARTGTTVAHVAAAAPAAAPAASAAASEPGEAAEHPGAVKSPMVGTAYVASEPGAAPFVKVGDSVSAGQTVLIVEAMKTMNPIPAPKAGRVASILVENQQPVEFGQALMIID